MQFNSKIGIRLPSYNEVGEEVATADTGQIRCGILEEIKRAEEVDGAKSKGYDLKVIIANKTFAPYDSIFSNDKAIFSYNGRMYRPMNILAIKDFSGKTKYYEVSLRQIKP